MNPSKILAALSGGVDSSVAALLLKEQGHEVFGATMALWDFEEVGGRAPHETSCCSLSSIEDARKVCWKLGIKHHVFNFRECFRETVIADFYSKYLEGRTPNPCVQCNAILKWGLLWQKARELGCEFVATGHYARVIAGPGGGPNLFKGKDPAKDQSYFLYAIPERALTHTRFPLGEITKEDARNRADKAGLLVSQKAESQEICFVPDNDYSRLVREMAEENGDTIEVGEIVNMGGQVVGEHSGIPFYTIGQRKGIGAHGSEPRYVVDIDARRNRLVIGSDADLYQDSLTADHLNWIGFEPGQSEFKCDAKIRYRAQEQPATVRVSGNEARVTFQEAQRAITPGQSVVFYDEERVLGGGVIKDAGKGETSSAKDAKVRKEKR